MKLALIVAELFRVRPGKAGRGVNTRVSGTRVHSVPAEEVGEAAVDAGVKKTSRTELV